MADHLADALNTIKTHEIVGQRTCTVRATQLIGKVLDVLRQHNYIENYQFEDNGRGGLYQVSLGGRINNCGVINPRFPVKRTNWVKEEQQYIPGVGVGLLIVSTSLGIMTNTDAEKKHVGGRLIAYVY